MYIYIYIKPIKHVDLMGFDEMQKLLSGAGLGAEQNAYNYGNHQKLGYNMVQPL